MLNYLKLKRNLFKTVERNETFAGIFEKTGQDPILKKSDPSQIATNPQLYTSPDQKVI
jgi:hypothetical protein